MSHDNFCELVFSGNGYSVGSLVSETLDSVSYTHLDVYKRQLCATVLMSFYRTNHNISNLNLSYNINRLQTLTDCLMPPGKGTWCPVSDVANSDATLTQNIWSNSCLLYTSRCV